MSALATNNDSNHHEEHAKGLLWTKEHCSHSKIAGGKMNASLVRAELALVSLQLLCVKSSTIVVRNICFSTVKH